MAQLSKSCFEELVLSTKELIYPAHRLLEETGLYFCLSGKLLIYLNDCKPLRLVEEGEFVG